MDMNGNHCANCGSTNGVQPHYIVPLDCGGRDVETNIIPLCRVCKYAVDHGVAIKEARKICYTK